MCIDMNKLQEAYGDGIENWGDLVNFKGEYINFGLWDNSLEEVITSEQRIASSLKLYERIIKKLNLNNSVVLELGCGRGVGIVQTLPINKCKKIIAVDINAEQIKRAKKNIDNELGKIGRGYEKINFIHSNVENINLPDNIIDVAYSVEAAQHFNSIFCFAKEMFRLLKNNGQLVFTSYFPTDKEHIVDLKKFLPLIDIKLENTTPAYEILKYFLQAGFSAVTCERIGHSVFHGYDKWIKQNNAESFKYYDAYLAGYIDYYIFTMIKGSI